MIIIWSSKYQKGKGVRRICTQWQMDDEVKEKVPGMQKEVNLLGKIQVDENVEFQVLQNNNFIF